MAQESRASHVKTPWLVYFNYIVFATLEPRGIGVERGSTAAGDHEEPRGATRSL